MQTARLLPFAEVLSRLSWSKSTLRRRIEDGTFPAPTKIGRCLYWPESVVESWINSLVKA